MAFHHCFKFHRIIPVVISPLAAYGHCANIITFTNKWLCSFIKYVCARDTANMYGIPPGDTTSHHNISPIYVE